MTRRRFGEEQQHAICMALLRMLRKGLLPPLRIDAREIRLGIGEDTWHRISWDQAERIVNGEDLAAVSLLLGRGPFATKGRAGALASSGEVTR